MQWNEIGIIVKKTVSMVTPKLTVCQASSIMRSVSFDGCIGELWNRSSAKATRKAVRMVWWCNWDGFDFDWMEGKKGKWKHVWRHIYVTCALAFGTWMQIPAMHGWVGPLFVSRDTHSRTRESPSHHVQSRVHEGWMYEEVDLRGVSTIYIKLPKKN